MTYKCLECGHIFESGEEARWVERHGLDTPPYEEWYGCPKCKGSFEETKRCKSCKKNCLPEELDEDDFCEECSKNE